MWAKSLAAWKMIVFATSMDRAEQDGGRSGDGGLVSGERGPRSEQTGRGETLQRDAKEPNGMVAVGVGFLEAIRLVYY